MKQITRLLTFCLCLLGLPMLAAPILQSGWTTTTSATTARNALGAASAADVAAKLGTNNDIVITPQEYGAVADGTTDDYIAMRDAILAANAGVHTVIDGGGKVFRLTNTLPIVRGKGITLRNMDWIFPPTNMPVLIVTNEFNQGVLPLDIGHVQAQFRLDSVNLFQNGGVPGTNSVGVCLGGFSETNNHPYSVNFVVENCIITNFWQGIFVNSAVQSRIVGNTIWGSYSNAIFAQGGIDMLDVSQNDLDNRSSGFSYDKNTNAIAIYIHPYQAVNVNIFDNNIGGYKQVLVAHDVSRLHWRGNQAEGHYTGDTNLTKIEFWNTSAFMEGFGVGSQSGSSNYLADIGIYAFGSGRHNLDRSHFVGFRENVTFDVFSTNVFDQVQWWPKIDTKTIVYRRDTWDGVRTTYNLNTPNGSMAAYNSTTNIVFQNPVGGFIWNNGGAEFMRVMQPSNLGTITGPLLFNGNITAAANVSLPFTTKATALQDQGGAGTFDIMSTNRNHIRFFTLDNDHTTVSLGISNNVLYSKADLNKGNAVGVLGIAAGGEVTTNGISISGTDSDAIHDNVAGEITAITAKGFLSEADQFVIEDSDAADAKKSMSYANLKGSLAQLSISSDSTGLLLDGDEATPGNSQYYGTDSGGTKGFYALPSGGSGSNGVSYALSGGGIGPAIRTILDGADEILEILYPGGQSAGGITNNVLTLLADGGVAEGYLTLGAESSIGGADIYMKEGGRNAFRATGSTRTVFASDGTTVAAEFATADAPVIGSYTYSQTGWEDGGILYRDGTEIKASTTLPITTLNVTTANIGNMGVTNNFGVTNNIIWHGLGTGNGGGITNIPLSSIRAGTNWVTTTPDYSKPWGLLTTNASFAWLTPINFNTGRTNVDQCVRLVTNSAASLITFTAPAGYTATGTLNVTNGGVTMVTFTEHPSVVSNLMAVPLK